MPSIVPPSYLVSVLVGASALAITSAFTSRQNGLATLFNRYRFWWNLALETTHSNIRLRSIPIIQFISAPLLTISALLLDSPVLLFAPLCAAVVPQVLLMRKKRIRREKLAAQLDNTLISLADALTTVPNLGEALRSVSGHLQPPMNEEISALLAEVQLGRSLDAALEKMASRLNLPGLEAAVSALTLGRRTGGDMTTMLKRIAAGIQELARLEGVIKTKTAEGRNQAWVMGLVPPVFILVMNKIDPAWLDPVWNDPIGWIFLGAAALLELLAIALLRRIMAIDI